MHATGYDYIDNGSLVRKQLNDQNVKSNFTDIFTAPIVLSGSFVTNE